MSNPAAVSSDTPDSSHSLRALLTRERWFEIGRIMVVGIIALLYWRNVLPRPALWLAIAFGLYPLVKAGVRVRQLGQI